MSELSETNEIDDFSEKVSKLSMAIYDAKLARNVELHNKLVIEYNELLESEQTDFSFSEAKTETDDSINSTKSNESYNELKYKHSGILNVINSIVSNCRKGKYTESDKLFFMSELRNAISQLDSIDADIAFAEKQKRKLIYSKIETRI